MPLGRATTLREDPAGLYIEARISARRGLGYRARPACPAIRAHEGYRYRMAPVSGRVKWLSKPRHLYLVAAGYTVEGASRVIRRRPSARAYVVNAWGGWRYPELLEHSLKSAGATCEYHYGYGWRLLSRYGAAALATARPTQEDPSLRALSGNYVLLRHKGQAQAVTEISEDYFSRLQSTPALHECEPGGEATLPYFAHPVMLRRIERRSTRSIRSDRPIRIGFAGQTGPGYGLITGFSQLAGVDMLSRPTILSLLCKEFGGQIADFAGMSDPTPRRPITTNIRRMKGGKPVGGQSLLVGDDYLEFLSSSDFFIAAPGIRIPHSHNLVEAMSQGSIPILNYSEWLSPALEDGRTCLHFETSEELSRVIQSALVMPASRIREMRAAVIHHYRHYLSPAAIGRQLLDRCPSKLFVNAEGTSLALWTSPDGTRQKIYTR
jgi:hypothetical protein